MATLVGKIDKDAFLASVKELVGGAEAFTEIEAKVRGVSLNPKDFFTTMPILLQLGNLVVAAVEVAKSRLSTEEKFDKRVAIDTAAQAVDDLVSFSGWAGSLLEMVDGFLIKLALSFLVEGKNAAVGHDWLADAKELLGVG